MNIVYLVFGQDNKNYQQAIFSIFTFLSQKKDEDRIIVLTDNWGKFNILNDKITIIKINDAILQKWKGEYDFFWRVKIKALQLIAEKWEDTPILYLDSDTFLFGSLDQLRLNLKTGFNMMHENEGKLCDLISKTERLMWRQIKGHRYGNIMIDNDKCMWNAGVIAIAGENKENINLALEICDNMCREKVTQRLIEQFAFSLAMNSSSKLIPAENEIGHYWGNKTIWNEKINLFFVNSFMKDISIEDQITEISKINFENIPIRIKIPNTRLRLEKLLAHIFPNRENIYISSN